MTKEQIEEKIKELRYDIFIEECADFMDFGYVSRLEKEIKDLEDELQTKN